MGYVMTKIYKVSVKPILLLIIIPVMLILVFVAITLTFNEYSQNFIRLGDVSMIYSDDTCLFIVELMPAKNISLTLINYSLNMPINNRTCIPSEGVNLDLPLKYGEPLRIACSGEFSKSYNESLAGKIIIYTNQSVEEHIFTVKPRRIGCIGCPH
jgi:hypothetical protein